MFIQTQVVFIDVLFIAVFQAGNSIKNNCTHFSCIAIEVITVNYALWQLIGFCSVSYEKWFHLVYCESETFLLFLFFLM